MAPQADPVYDDVDDLDAILAEHGGHVVFYSDGGCVLRPGSYFDDALAHCRTWRLANRARRVEEAVRAALAEHEHADTCITMLSPGAGDACNCWRSAVAPVVLMPGR